MSQNIPGFRQSMEKWIKSLKEDFDHSIQMSTIEGPVLKWKTSKFYEGLAHEMGFKDWNTAKSEIIRITGSSTDINKDLLDLASRISISAWDLLKSYELENFEAIFPKAAWWNPDGLDFDGEPMGGFEDHAFDMDLIENDEFISEEEKEEARREFEKEKIQRAKKTFSLKEKKSLLKQWEDHDWDLMVSRWTCYGEATLITPTGNQSGKINQYSAWIRNVRNKLGVALRFQKAYQRFLNSHRGPQDRLHTGGPLRNMPRLEDLIYDLCEGKEGELTKGYECFLPVEESPYFDFLLFHIAEVLQVEVDWLLGLDEFHDGRNIRLPKEDAELTESYVF